MPNQFIEQQYGNIKCTIQLFESACRMAATKDDGKISIEEEKALYKIKEAGKRYTNELEKIISRL
ncbi:MAG: hypothetical protein RR235_09845 [Oscillospiraceae bacterium]